jgi:serine protease AprX
LQQFIQKLSPVLLRPEFQDCPDKPCRVIVELVNSQTKSINTYVETNAGKIHHRMRLHPYMVVELPYEAMQYLVISPHIRKIWHDMKVNALLDVAVPTAGGVKAHGMGFTGKDVTVAVIDTGVFPHPDLIMPQSRIVAWHDLVNERAFPYDDNGHGTHVSGIIAGNGVSSRGKYTGMAPEANIVAIKVLDREGSGNTSDVITALEWCVENQKTYNIRAINLSIGATAQDSCREDPLCRVVETAWNKGMVVCAAAGNDGPDSRTINTPGISPYTITVGNMDDKGTEDIEDDLISDSSSRGPTIDNLMKPDLLAPGTNIMSLQAGRGYRSLSGTSMATPMVTGAVAQVYQKWPALKPNEVRRMLVNNARNLGFQSNNAGSRALKMDTLFEEHKQGEESVKSFLSSLFGEDSLLGKLFGKKKANPDLSNNEAKGEGSRSFNPLYLLMLLPLALIGM